LEVIYLVSLGMKIPKYNTYLEKVMHIPYKKIILFIRLFMRYLPAISGVLMYSGALGTHLSSPVHHLRVM